MILNSLLWLLHTSQYISSENLVLDQDNNFYLMILGILVICLLVNVWNYYGKKLHVNLFWELIKKVPYLQHKLNRGSPIVFLAC